MREARTFAGTYEQIREIGRFVLHGAIEAGFDERTRYHIELACDEACTNIIEHAYQHQDGEIAVKWHIGERDFRVQFVDFGTPFDAETERVALPTDGETLVAGGLGMHFMHTLMDEVRYESDANGNRVTLMKWLPTDESIVVRETLDGLPVVRVFGRLDTTLTDELEAALTPLVAQPEPKVIVDLSETTYCNSAGLRTLVTAWRKAHQNGGDVVLTSLNERVLEIFQMVGFDKIFRVFDERGAAIAFLKQVSQ